MQGITPYILPRGLKKMCCGARGVCPTTLGTQGVRLPRWEVERRRPQGLIVHPRQDLDQTKLIAIDVRHRSEYHFNQPEISQDDHRRVDLLEIAKLFANWTVKEVDPLL